jgi:hypothetical protein
VPPFYQKLNYLLQDSSLSEQKRQSIGNMPLSTENEQTTLAAKKRFCIRKHVSALQAGVQVTSML